MDCTGDGYQNLLNIVNRNQSKSCTKKNIVILQVDGNTSEVLSDIDDNITDDESEDTSSTFETDDEAEPFITPVNLVPVAGQHLAPDQPMQFEG